MTASNQAAVERDPGQPTGTAAQTACELPHRPGRTSAKNLALRTAGYLFTARRLRQLLSTDFLPQDERAQLREQKIARLLRHAQSTVDVYREAMAEIDGDLRSMKPSELLRRMPFLTKHAIASNFPDRMLSNGTRSVASQHLYSSGTTADRIDVVVGASGQAARLALVLWRHRLGGNPPLGRARVEIPADACSRVCGAEGDRPSGYVEELRSVLTQEENLLSAALRTVDRRFRSDIRHGLIYDRTLPPFGARGTGISGRRLQEYLDAIRDVRPHLLSGLPTYLHQLARFIQRTDQTVHVPVIHPMGALSTTGQREMIGKAFGGRVYDTYGSSELGTFSAQCEEQGHLHVAESSYVVEVVRAGKPVAEGELGHIAVTCLDNYAMPMIRYLLGDVGRWFGSGCACRRTTHRIECNGRLQALIVTSTGKLVTEEDVMQLAYAQPGLEHFQLVEHRPGRFDLMVVPAPEGAVDHDDVRAAFVSLLEDPEELEVFPVETIYPEETGKFRFVRSASWERFV